MKWPPRNRVYKANRREIKLLKKDGTPYKKTFFEHQCNKCKKWFRAKDITMDHVIPVVPPASKRQMSEAEEIGNFVVSLLCYEDNWQKLCNKCHDIKSDHENKLRKLVKNT